MYQELEEIDQPFKDLCGILYVHRAYGNRLILQGLMCVFLSIFASKAQGNRLILQGLMCIFLFRKALKATEIDPEVLQRLTCIFLLRYVLNATYWTYMYIPKA